MPTEVFSEDDFSPEAVVQRFEACDFAPGEFTHQAHLLVALWYLTHLPSEQAAHEHMRAGLKHFLAHHGFTDRYHETITRFWLTRVRLILAQQTAAGRKLSEVARELLSSCGDAKLLYEYYSCALLQSERARVEWVEPDITPLTDERR